MYFILCCAAADFLSLKIPIILFSLYLLIASANFKRLVVHQSSKSRSRHSCCSFQIAIWLLLLVFYFFITFSGFKICFVKLLFSFFLNLFCCQLVVWYIDQGQALDGSISSSSWSSSPPWLALFKDLSREPIYF